MSFVESNGGRRTGCGWGCEAMQKHFTCFTIFALTNHWLGLRLEFPFLRKPETRVRLTRTRLKTWCQTAGKLCSVTLSRKPWRTVFQEPWSYSWSSPPTDLCRCSLIPILTQCHIISRLSFRWNLLKSFLPLSPFETSTLNSEMIVHMRLWIPLTVSPHPHAHPLPHTLVLCYTKFNDMAWQLPGS